VLGKKNVTEATNTIWVPSGDQGLGDFHSTAEVLDSRPNRKPRNRMSGAGSQ